MRLSIFSIVPQCYLARALRSTIVNYKRSSRSRTGSFRSTKRVKIKRISNVINLTHLTEQQLTRHANARGEGLSMISSDLFVAEEGQYSHMRSYPVTGASLSTWNNGKKMANMPIDEKMTCPNARRRPERKNCRADNCGIPGAERHIAKVKFRIIREYYARTINMMSNDNEEGMQF
jgi:hypothetical protein